MRINPDVDALLRASIAAATFAINTYLAVLAGAKRLPVALSRPSVAGTVPSSVIRTLLIDVIVLAVRAASSLRSANKWSSRLIVVRMHQSIYGRHAYAHQRCGAFNRPRYR